MLTKDEGWDSFYFLFLSPLLQKTRHFHQTEKHVSEIHTQDELIQLMVTYLDHSLKEEDLEKQPRQEQIQKHTMRETYHREVCQRLDMKYSVKENPIQIRIPAAIEGVKETNEKQSK